MILSWLPSWLRTFLEVWGALSALAALVVVAIVVIGTIYDRRQWGRTFWKDDEWTL